MGLLSLFKVFSKERKESKNLKDEILEEKNDSTTNEKETETPKIESISENSKKLYNEMDQEIERDNKTVEEMKKEAYMRKMNELMARVANECTIKVLDPSEIILKGYDKNFEMFRRSMNRWNIKEYARRVFMYEGRYYPICHLSDFTAYSEHEDILMIAYQIDREGKQYKLFGVLRVEYSDRPYAIWPTEKQKKYFYKNPAMVRKVNDTISRVIDEKYYN